MIPLLVFLAGPLGQPSLKEGGLASWVQVPVLREFLFLCFRIFSHCAFMSKNRQTAHTVCQILSYHIRNVMSYELSV